MQSEITVALAKVVKETAEKQAAELLPEKSVFEIDALVRVFGTFKKGEGYEQTFPNKINWQILFALAASKLNKETRATVIEAYNEALESDEGIKTLLDEVKTPVQRKIDSMKKATASPKILHKITTDLTCEVVGNPTIKVSPQK